MSLDEALNRGSFVNSSDMDVWHFKNVTTEYDKPYCKNLTIVLNVSKRYSWYVAWCDNRCAQLVIGFLKYLGKINIFIVIISFV